MKSSNDPFPARLNRPPILPSTIFLLFIMLSYSCVPNKCVLCDSDHTTVYNIELKGEGREKIGKDSILSFFAPVPIEVSKNRTDLYIVDCEGQEPYKMGHEELETFLKQHIYRVDTSSIKQIITTSDTDFPPTEVKYLSLDSLRLCNRFRKPMKIEVRGMIGSRLDWNNTGIFYSGYDGGTYYERNDFINKVMGFGPGGTNMIAGIEASLLPRLFLVAERHSFNLGVLTGFWPVDGGSYIPVSLHPQFTFNEISAPLWGNCNAWYLYGDLGSTIDASGDIPIFAGGKLTSWFTGIGAGIDLWKNRNHDFSVDLGYRYTSLGLPFNEEYKECLQNSGKGYLAAYPSRQASQLFIRLGFTW